MGSMGLRSALWAALTLTLVASFAACGSDESASGSTSTGGGSASSGQGGEGGVVEPIPEGKCRDSKSEACPGTCVNTEDVACYVATDAPPTTCVNDPDCGGGGAICAFIDASCADGPVFACAAGCVDDTLCPPSMVCGPDHHCQKIPCKNGCPDNFLCSPEKHCVRKSCSLDADCDYGRCVLKTCHDDFGDCAP